jgi:regulator of protease activity HflC (stomatin/prohibitin superfamily)
LPTLVFVVLLGAGLSLAYSRFALADSQQSVLIAVGSAIAAFVVSYSIKVADQWERVVLLRLGRFRALKGPGLFFIIPAHANRTSGPARTAIMSLATCFNGRRA